MVSIELGIKFFQLLIWLLASLSLSLSFFFLKPVSLLPTELQLTWSIFSFLNMLNSSLLQDLSCFISLKCSFCHFLHGLFLLLMIISSERLFMIVISKQTLFCCHSYKYPYLLPLQHVFSLTIILIVSTLGYCLISQLECNYEVRIHASIMFFFVSRIKKY